MGGRKEGQRLRAINFEFLALALFFELEPAIEESLNHSPLRAPRTLPRECAPSRVHATRLMKS